MPDPQPTPNPIWAQSFGSGIAWVKVGTNGRRPSKYGPLTPHLEQNKIKQRTFVEFLTHPHPTQLVGHTISGQNPKAPNYILYLMSEKLRSPQMVKKKGKICAENAQRSGVLQRRVPRNHGLSPCPAQFCPKLIRRPVSRVLSTSNWIGDHSSGMMIAHHLTRPTRKAMRRHMKCFPYLVLLRTGFTLPDLLPDPRCALTAPFHPYRAVAGEPCEGGRFAFCGTFPRLAPGGRYPPSCLHGARTFLHPGRTRNSGRPAV